MVGVKVLLLTRVRVSEVFYRLFSPHLDLAYRVFLKQVVDLFVLAVLVVRLDLVVLHVLLLFATKFAKGDVRLVFSVDPWIERTDTSFLIQEGLVGGFLLVEKILYFFCPF